MASAFAILFHRGPGGSTPSLITNEHPPFHRGSPEEQYLRNRSSYLAPGAGGKLRLLQHVVMGLLFNLLFIGLFLAIVAGVMTVVYAYALPGLTDDNPGVHLPRGFWLVPAGFAAAGALLGLGHVAVNIRREKLRAFVEAWSSRLLLAGLAIAFFSLALPLLVDGVHQLRDRPKTPGTETIAIGPLAGIITLVAGVLAQIRARVSDPPRVLEDVTRGARAARKAKRGLRLAFVYFAGAVVGPLLLLGCLVGLIVVGLDASSSRHVGDGILIGMGVCALVFGISYATADLTSWSLHPFYKRRLWSAFSLVRVTDPDGDPHGKARERDLKWPLKISDSRVWPPLDDRDDHAWPTLLVCAAANISDTSATPPGRSVTSFTFSSSTTGGPLVGAVATSLMERRSQRKDLDLMAAVAMSGAALSPSMGKITKPPLRFLMALANVRLGVWVPNPRWAGRWPLKYRTRPRPWYLLCELLGRNQLEAPFLYVTDGGHYENLGLVELLRRGCTDVYCFDASGGDSFSQLGDAIALARSELDVEIHIDPQPLVPKPPRQLAETDCVRGTIKFPTGESGTLVYAPTVMTAGAPWDVHAYHDADKTFPHNPTSDQLYTDQKFEAYRVLGDRAARTALYRMKKAANAGKAGRLPRSPTGWEPADPRCEGQGPAEQSANGAAPAGNHRPVAGGV
jgi:hypothetical protein